MKFRGLLLMVIVVASLTACDNSGDVKKKEPEKVVENQNEKTNEEVAPKEEEAPQEVARYGLGETLIVSDNSGDLYEITFDKAFLTDQRNEFYEGQVDNVVVLEYTYKNLNEEEGTYIVSGMDYKVYDSTGKSLETYPASDITMFGDTVSVGRMSTAQEAFGFSGDANQTLEIEIYSPFITKPLAIVEIQPQ